MNMRNYVPVRERFKHLIAARRRAGPAMDFD